MTRALTPTTTGQSRNVTRPDYWLTIFLRLRVDRARGDPAPHKPLLLVFRDPEESGDLRDVLPLSQEHAFRVCT